jgi:proteasome lid subunit RPN8/RPN11
MMTEEQPASTTGPDASSIDASDWPLRPVPGVIGERLPRYQAVVRQCALDEVHGHGRSITSAEVCGVLIGNVYRDEHGPYLYVTNAIRGDRASGLATQVTFTAETWSEIQRVMDQEHPDERIVGWYHTHPGFGIFLSGMDLFIQDHFFNLPWQVALVFDPLGGDEGMFYWKEGKADRQPFLIEQEDTRAHAPTLAEIEAANQHLPSRQSPQRSLEPPIILSSEEVENKWTNVETAPHHAVPLWLIGAIAFAISFGCAMWAVFSMNSEVIVVPHHVDHAETQQAPAVQGDQ